MAASRRSNRPSECSDLGRTKFRTPTYDEREAIENYFDHKVHTKCRFPTAAAVICGICSTLMCVTHVALLHNPEDPALLISAVFMLFVAIICIFYILSCGKKYSAYLHGNFDVIEGFVLRIRKDKDYPDYCNVLFCAFYSQDFRCWYRVPNDGVKLDAQMLVARTLKMDNSGQSYFAFTQRMLRPFFPKKKRQNQK